MDGQFFWGNTYTKCSREYVNINVIDWIKVTLRVFFVVARTQNKRSHIQIQKQNLAKCNLESSLRHYKSIRRWWMHIIYSGKAANLPFGRHITRVICNSHALGNLQIKLDSIWLALSLGLSLYLALSNKFVLAPITTNQLTGEDNNVHM